MSNIRIMIYEAYPLTVFLVDKFRKFGYVPGRVLTGGKKLTSIFSIYFAFHAILSNFQKDVKIKKILGFLSILQY